MFILCYGYVAFEKPCKYFINKLSNNNNKKKKKLEGEDEQINAKRYVFHTNAISNIIV